MNLGTAAAAAEWGKGPPSGGPLFLAGSRCREAQAMVDLKSTISVLSRRHNGWGTITALRLPNRIFSQILVSLVCACWTGAPAHGATVMASVTANNVKPLSIAKLQDLDLGTVTLGPGVWSNETISLSQAGVLSCTSADIVCSGATTVAQYNVQGSNQQTVRISAPNVTLTNQSDSSQSLTLVTDAPATVYLTNSGAPGVNFSIGGSVAIDSTTAAGTYVGTFNVTADY
jgi:hypothetical protein